MEPSTETYASLGAEIERELDRNHLRRWFPKCVDPEGGFLQQFDREWRPMPGSRRKGLIFQARSVWLAAAAAPRGSEYGAIAEQAAEWLWRALWDCSAGGFFAEIEEDGLPTGKAASEKHVYGEAFGIYALARAAAATGSRDILNLATQAFGWLDGAAHDADEGGYHETVRSDGSPLLASASGSRSERNGAGQPYGYKSQNTHIHLAEAFTELYSVWPDSTLRERLEELLHLIRDVMACPPGCLNLFFDRGWRAPAAADSFGHDVEAGFLITSAAAALGRPDDGDTWQVARMLADHALEFGWDHENGGLYNTGDFLGPVHDRNKIWWVQAESMNALINLHRRFRKQTNRYWRAFVEQWEFIRNHQIDSEFGGWYGLVSESGQPMQVEKAHPWKAGYHDGRAMLGSVPILAELSQENS